MTMGQGMTISLAAILALGLTAAGDAETAKDAFQRAGEALQNRDFTQAIAAYKEAGESCRNDECRANAANGLGYAYMKNREFAAAIPHFERAISLVSAQNTDLAKVSLNNVGFSQLKLYQSGVSGTPALESALAAFSKVAEIDSSYRPDNLNLVKSYMEQHQKWAAAAVARADFPPRQLAASGNYTTYKEAALAAEEEWDFAFAQAAYERAEAVANTSKGKASAANMRGLLDLKMRNPKAARENFSRSVQLNPESKYAWNNLGASLMRLYEFGMGGTELVQEAVEAFTKVQAIDPTYKPENLSQAQHLLQELAGPAPAAEAQADVTE